MDKASVKTHSGSLSLDDEEFLLTPSYRILLRVLAAVSRLWIPKNNAGTRKTRSPRMLALLKRHSGDMMFNKVRVLEDGPWIMQGADVGIDFRTCG